MHKQPQTASRTYQRLQQLLLLDRIRSAGNCNSSQRNTYAYANAKKRRGNNTHRAKQPTRHTKIPLTNVKSSARPSKANTRAAGEAPAADPLRPEPPSRKVVYREHMHKHMYTKMLPIVNNPYQSAMPLRCYMHRAAAAVPNQPNERGSLLPPHICTALHCIVRKASHICSQLASKTSALHASHNRMSPNE